MIYPSKVLTAARQMQESEMIAEDIPLPSLPPLPPAAPASSILNVDITDVGHPPPLPPGISF